MSKEKTGLFSSTELDSAVLREGFALSDKWSKSLRMQFLGVN